MTVPAPSSAVIAPHPGAQTAFLANRADICIGGGAAGGGKTRGLLMEPLRHIHVPGFSAVMFRRTSPQLTGVGGPWLESLDLYPATGGVATHLRWAWRSGARVHFRHMQHAKDRLAYKGWQITLLLFDQLEEFLEEQFWYLVSRNRSTCGVRPYVRATCNPVPETDEAGGWLHRLVSWWLDEDTGYARPDRAGRVRWFVRDGNELVWADRREELTARYPRQQPLSLSFVPMRLEDNPTLLRTDPGYVAKLQALPFVERQRLLGGNWNVTAMAGTVFKRAWFAVVDAAPRQAWRCRFWDCAATEGHGDYTAGVRVSLTPDGRVFVEDVVRGQWSPREVDAIIRQTAALDGPGVLVREEREPGASGKAVVDARGRALHGYDYEGVPSTTSKLTKWRPYRSQVEAGNVCVLNRPWAKAFLDEHEQADGRSTRDDQVDAACGAYLALVREAPVGLIQTTPMRVGG